MMRKAFMGFSILMLVLLIQLSWNPRAKARDAEGKLSFIMYPVSTRPQIVSRGELAFVDLAKKIHDNCGCKLHLYLIGNGDKKELAPLQLIPGPDTGVFDPSDSGYQYDPKIYRFASKLPEDIDPGLYDLEAYKGANHDVSRRAVLILGPDEEKPLTILHLTNVVIGTELMESDYPDMYKMLFEEMPDEANNKVKPDLILITGNITFFSKPVEYQWFFDILDRFQAPTFVLAGSLDADSEAFMGPGNYSFRYGKYLFLALDTRKENSLSLQDPAGEIDWAVSQLKADSGSAFKVVFTYSIYDLDPDALNRALLAPGGVDLLLYGHDPRAPVPAAGSKPAAAVFTHAFVDGFYRVIVVEDGKITSNTEISQTPEGFIHKTK